MERKSFLNRAVISYISTRSPIRQVGAGLKDATKVGVQGGATTTNTTTAGAAALNGTPLKPSVFDNSNNKNFHNMAVTHYSTTTTPHPYFAATSTHIGMSNVFAYLATILSNSIETSVLIAPPPPKAHKNVKNKSHRRKVTQPTRRISSAAASTDLLLFSLDPLHACNGRNGSAELSNAAHINLQPISNTSKSLDQRDFRILTYTSNYDGYPGGAGDGRFSCLVEAVEAHCDCGWSTHSLKVVNPSSSVAGVNEFPSMAGVLTMKYGKVFCGAVTIHHRFLLSAAHCFISAATNRSELIQVVVGEHDLSTALESVYTRYYNIDTIILHENFRATANQLRNDIALLHTSETIEWNGGVAPACLPFRSITGTDGGRKPPIAGQRVETAGWGSISFGGPQSTLLLTTHLDVVGAEECRTALGAVPPATFCTFTPGRDTCQYDSGGGLYMREGGRLFVVGIVSYGYGCAARHPSVNTKVASYIRWIKSQTSQVTYCIK
ncbi:venom serine protease 34 [Anastrepha ludens]|uniref:venom serine protease 34 n=1 Tax=Anastrepha ludens TaxID=28586 RepID=UPI0023B06F14|nr:venom serine protease 34 [Anastrepha ludens]